MNFKRMMVLGAVASALVFTGCQDRRGDDTATGGVGDQTMQGTGGSGNVDSTIPGSSNTLGGVRQDDQPGADLGATGASGGTLDDTSGTGGSGAVNEQDTAGSSEHGGTGGSGSIHEHDTPNYQGGTGGSGSLNEQGGGTDQSWTGSTGSVDDQSGIGGSGTKSGAKSGTKGTMGATDAGTPGGSDAGM